MKKYGITIGILLSILIGSQLAYADSTTQDSQGNLSVLRCIQKGDIDFGAFLSSMIYNDSFTEGILEPWKDVLDRNQCQSGDVYSLIKQEDKMRSAIRDAFLTCNNQAVPQLKKAYQKMMVEIYYVRHVVNSALITGLPVLAQTTSFTEAAVVDRNQLYRDMSAKYVKESFMSQADFDLLFLKLESKYADRRTQYLDCTKSSWEVVGNKWNAFIKFFKEDAAGLKEAGKTIGAVTTGGKDGKGPSLVNELKTIKFVELFTTDESVLDYIKAFGQVNVNNLATSAAYDEAKNYINTHLNNGSGLTQGQYVSQSVGAENNYQMEKDIDQIKTDFDTRYKSAADGSMEQFIDALDGRQVGGQDDGTLEIINNSFSPLNEVLSLSTKIKDRECKR